MVPEPRSLSDVFLLQSPACHWVWDRKGVFTRLFGDPSPVFGKPSADLLNHTFEKSLERSLVPTWTDRFSRAMAGELVELRERHGAAVWYISLFPIRLEDEVEYVGGSAREVTIWATAEQELRYTVLGALKAQEYERNKTSKFLHDTVGQNLTALGLQLDLIRMDVDAGQGNASTQIGEVQKLLESIMEQVRDYHYELNPSTVERAGLRAALDRLCVRMRDRFAGSLRVNVDPSMKFDPKVAVALYHIAQEAVENAVQHSGCSAIEIAVKSTRTGTSLEVKDDGKGFDPADLLDGGRGLGLLSMDHYAAQGGLDLSIKSTRGAGTKVRVSVPDPSKRGE